MITLQLTREEANKLETYLLVTTKFRTGEVEALNALHQRLKDEGETDTEVLNKLKSNAAFWQEQCDVMDIIQQRLLKNLTTPQKEGEKHEN